MLREVARRLQSAVRESDLVARLGGDEFAVVCPGIDDVAVLAALAERVTEVLGLPMTVTGHQGSAPVQVGGSVGAAVVEVGNGSPDALLAAADAALYSAKSSARGGWRAAPAPSGSGSGRHGVD